MPYTATTWVMNVTPGNATNLNNLESQYAEATLSFNTDLFTAFVLSGLVCTKNGTIATQLDVTAGVAYLLQADGTTRRRSPPASTPGQFTTATPSTTYFLDLNPDGTWSWATTHSAVTNHLTICSATTDVSGNILAVTDARPLNTTALSGMAGGLAFATNALFVGSLGGAQLNWNSITANALWIGTPASGAARGITFGTWDGAASHGPFSIGGQFGGALAWVDNSGNYVGPAGGGVPTTRNGVATSVPIYTNTGTPSNPPTGSIWIKA